jgi:hypothetical protein
MMGYKLRWPLLILLWIGMKDIRAIEISGTGIFFANETITLEKSTDFISQYRQVLTRTSVDEKGNFDLKANEALTGDYVYYIRSGRFEGVFYGNAQGRYTVNLVYSNGDAAQRFDKIEFPVQLIQGTDHLHAAVVRYFNQYDRFLNAHYYDYALQEFSGSEAQRVQLLKHSKNKPDLFPSDLNNRDSVTTSNFREMLRNFKDTVLNEEDRQLPFLVMFRDYDVARMEMVAGKSKTVVVQTLFADSTLHMDHPAFVQCAEMLFSSLFTQTPTSYFLSAQKALNSGQLDSIDFHFARFPIIASRPHLEMACLIAWRDMLAKNQMPLALHDALLQQLISKSKIPAVQMGANQLIAQAHQCKKNARATDFTCLDLKGKSHQAKEWEGKLTYVFFYTTWNGYAMKQLLATDNMANELVKDCNIVAICMDDKEETWRKAIQGKKWKCQMRYAGNIPELREQYCLSSLPMAILITPDGKYLQDFTRLPEAGVGAQIEKWLMAHPGQVGEGTWKEN